MDKRGNETCQQRKADVEIVLCSDAYPIEPTAAITDQVSAVFSAIGSADFSVVNFEIPITERGTPVQKLLNIRAPKSAAEGLASIGFKVATVANNHAVDYGWDGLVDTRRALQHQSIKVVGMGETVAAAVEPIITTVKSTKIGVLGFSCLTPAGVCASADRPGIAGLRVATAYEVDPGYQMEEPGDASCITVRTQVHDDDLRLACQAVREARQNCDFLITSIHWGFGSTEALAEYQWPLAKALIDAGADVIHGHHPHAIQAIGFYMDKPIVFSANVLIGQQVFLPASDQVKRLWEAMSVDGFLTRLSINVEGVRDIEIIPTSLNAERLPEIAMSADADRILERLARLSEPQGGIVRREGGRIVVQPSRK